MDPTTTLYFRSQFLRKIGWFKILEIAVSPACPAILSTIASGEGGSLRRRRKQRRRGKGPPGSIGHLDRIHLVYERIYGSSKLAHYNSNRNLGEISVYL